MTRGNWALALHGGAGAVRERSYEREELHMLSLLQRGQDLLSSGVSALDVVTIMAEALEASGLHVAGRGAHPNKAGAFELDAAIMDGPSRGAGAVAALQGFASPIRAARAVMEHSPHVLLVGEGASAFAKEHRLTEIGDPAQFFTSAGSGVPIDGGLRGTIGAVALHNSGRLAVATSTAGTRNKLHGRVGDSAIIGAGCWADESVAVSCTGIGEYFRCGRCAQPVRSAFLSRQNVSRAH
jgi:isoaspartyl peptidase/L-asparaginase-like protein (Ntn-hydrolase superfamily)